MQQFSHCSMAERAIIGRFLRRHTTSQQNKSELLIALTVLF